MISLRRGAVALDIAPERGGGVLRFHVDGQALFADVRGPAPADLACIPLLPFANRIADARFVADSREILLEPAHDEPHALHGTGWLRPWNVLRGDADWVQLWVDSAAGDGGWPWPWHGHQRFQLTDFGYRHVISVVNFGDTPMPAGIGLHPWLPRTPETRYLGLHQTEWQPGLDKLPRDCIRANRPIDWWHDAPVASRHVDCCYAERDGSLQIDWPERGLRLEIVPDAVFSFTQVYVPDADLFCVEPVSHLPDAVNRGGDTGLHWLAPMLSLTAAVDFRVSSV